MTLSASLYVLKRRAKALARAKKIPLHQALDRIAAEEGFRSWSLLMAKATTTLGAAELYAGLEPGDLLLLGARPGQGKTLTSLDLAAEAVKAGRRAWFFSLEYTARDVAERFRAIRIDPAALGGRFVFDNADTISAGHVIGALEAAPRGTFAVIDYLQLLDQRRENPPLGEQVAELKAFARERGVTIVFISQIDRSFDPAKKPVPGPEDVRLPNPLDLGLFDKTCFLHGGDVRMGAVGAR